MLFLTITYSITASKLDAWAYENGLLYANPSTIVVPILTLLYFISFRRSLSFSVFILKRTSFFFMMIFVISLFYIFLFFFDKNLVSIELYFLPLLSGFLIIIVCSVARDIRVIRKISLCLLLLSSGSVYIDYIDPLLLGLNQNRAAGFSMNPNGAAVAIVFAFLIFIKFEGSFKKDLIIFLFCFGAVLLTFSRGGLFVFIVSSVFWIYNYKSNRKQKILFLILLFIIVFLFFSLFLANFLNISQGKEQQTFDAMISRINPLNQRSQLERDDSRLVIILTYLDLVAESPVLGYGTGFNYNYWLHAHNTFLNMYIEGGLFSLLSFLCIFLFLIIKSIKNGDNKSIIIILSMFLFCFFNNQLFFNRAAILGLIYVISSIALSVRTSNYPRAEPGGHTCQLKG